MRRSKRLTLVVSKLSTVCMLDELSLQLSHSRHSMAVLGQKAAGWTPRCYRLGSRRHDLSARGRLRGSAQVCLGVSVRRSGTLRVRVATEGPAVLIRLS